MKNLLVPIFFIILFSSTSFAQLYHRNIDVLKKLDKIVLRDAAVISTISSINEETFGLYEHIENEFQDTFTKLFNDLEVQIIELGGQDTLPPQLFIDIDLIEVYSKEFRIQYLLYILEPVSILRSEEKIIVGSYILKKNFVYQYTTYKLFIQNISEQIKELSKEFELDYYRSSK